MKDLALFPKYESYKDSGEQWMSKVPKHWEIKKLKHLFYEKSHIPNMDLNCGAISFGEVVYKNDENIPLLTKASYQEVLKNEILINPLNLNYDLKSLRVALSEIDVVVSAGYIVLKDKGRIFLRYFKYLLHRYDVAYMKLLGSGVRQTINFGHIANSFLVLPTEKEQKAIADFLDKKTTKIDQAIAIKEKQIELLKERKQILIQNAVTRGLDPNVPIKDSGVEWIGEIPTHWELMKIRAFSRVVRGGSPRPAGDPKYFSTEGTSWVTVGEVTKDDNIYLMNTDSYLTKIGVDNSRYIEGGTFILTNSGATLGVPKITKIKCCINDGVLAFIELKKAKIFDKFLYYYFLWQVHRLRDEMNQGATQPNLNTNLVKNMPIGLCSLKEQKEIVEFIEYKLEKIDMATELQKQQIQKLKEYKATLINSAVTGKIKVPGVA